MTRAKSNGNGHLSESVSHINQAMASLNQAMATFLARGVAIDAQIAETNRITSERFARIETMLLEHSRILMEHSRILHALPDAIREKIGFKGGKPQASE